MYERLKQHSESDPVFHEYSFTATVRLFSNHFLFSHAHQQQYSTFLFRFVKYYLSVFLFADHILPILFRCNAVFIFEDSVEVSHIGETDQASYFIDLQAQIA